ncbi:hypothetical protein [Actinoplanes sp. GCM10030250]|uniref:hypothetical protein n=1 Tax=Actinoplanes sp. GCM10030250 TaxID=3273376 RepID=UPI00360603D0
MKPLSELLEEARKGGPPPRFDVDDMVAAGQRRVRRRTTEWGFAALVAVALAIGVPQVLLGNSERQVVSPATATAAPVPRYSFTFPFRGYTAGEYRVMDPETVRLGRMSAAINRDGKEAGTLSVYPPGAELARLHGGKVTAAEPVHGRTAAYLATGYGGEALAWTYADGTVVMVDLLLGGSRADVRRIAEGFTLGAGEPARLGFRVSYVPDDYRLVNVSASRRSGAADSLAYLLPAAAAEALLADPDRSIPSTRMDEVIGIRIAPVKDLPETSVEPACTAGSCTMLTGDKRYGLEVFGRGIDAPELRKIFDSILQADLTDPSTWYPVDDAFPASVRM